VTEQELKPGPGEARTRKRQMRQLAFIMVSGLIGGIVGFSTGFFDQGDGNLFHGDWDELSLDPAIALLLAGVLLLGLVVLPIWGFRMIDDFKREMNLIAYSAGLIGVMSGFPVWAMLYAGGFAPPPHAFGVWAIGFVSMTLAYGYARWLR
jgi:hypothetical protein